MFLATIPLLLALLSGPMVLPGPPSGFVQPPGMICVGECEGPVVYGAGKRWDVVCPMNGDTCSDGRKITTERATPVPCETSPGVWEIVPEDVGCYGVRGLESWAANTSYLSWGAELDRSVWTKADGAVVDGRVLSGPGSPARIIQTGIEATNGPITLACRMRALSGDSARFRITAPGGAGGFFRTLEVGPEWATYSETGSVSDDPTSLSFHFYPNDAVLEIAGCWLTKTDTPGRACWGGEAPVTCAEDRHTISTEGWPTESGEISIRLAVPDTPGTHYVWDSRIDASDTSRAFWQSGTLSLRLPRVINIPWPPGEALLGVRREGDTIIVTRDGVVVANSSGSPPMSYGLTARLGGHASASGQELNGSIRSLRIRSTE